MACRRIWLGIAEDQILFIPTACENAKLVDR